MQNHIYSHYTIIIRALRIIPSDIIISCSSFVGEIQKSHEVKMNKNNLTFNDLPMVVAELRDEVVGMKVALLDLQKGQNKQNMERVRRTMNVEEAADYLRMPVNTLYMKLQKGEVPGSKPGKRWVLFNDELDKWLEVKRRNAVPMTTEEENDAILASHRRKPNKREW